MFDMYCYLVHGAWVDEAEASEDIVVTQAELEAELMDDDE